MFLFCFVMSFLLLCGLWRKFSKQAINHDINSGLFEKSYPQIIINLERLSKLRNLKFA